MIELLGKELVYERIVKPMFLKQPTDENIVNENINNKLPKELKYLEDNIKGNYLVGDEITIADIALATQFLNATYAQYHIDKENYPKLSNMLNNVWNTKAFKEIIADDIKAKEKMSETA